jgi:hypothetical protein
LLVPLLPTVHLGSAGVVAHHRYLSSLLRRSQDRLDWGSIVLLPPLGFQIVEEKMGMRIDGMSGQQEMDGHVISLKSHPPPDLDPTNTTGSTV